MDLENVPFQLILVVVFLLIGAIRWVLEKFAGKNKSTSREQWEQYEETTSHQSSGSLEDLYEEARREILLRQNRHVPEPEVIEEKLSKYRNPPPPLPQQPSKAKASPPPVSKSQSPPPLTDFSKTVKTERRVLSAEEQKALDAFQQHEEGQQSKKKNSQTGKRIREMLDSPSAAQDAIILTEIFGPPKGMK